MANLQEIADAVGVSRTTVSNVLYGRTKRVSPQTLQAISTLLDAQGYVPNGGGAGIKKLTSHVIAVVLSPTRGDGSALFQDPFFAEFLGLIQQETKTMGYYTMALDGQALSDVVDMASRWNVDGLLLLGFTQKQYQTLKKQLNKPMVLVDGDVEQAEGIYRVGSDDYNGGWQIGHYLLRRGFDSGIFLGYGGSVSRQRWLGFANAQGAGAQFVLLPQEQLLRKKLYREQWPIFAKAGALAFSADYLAIEAMQFFQDQGVSIPRDLSISGFDDGYICQFARPKLTTIGQNISLKAKTACQMLAACMAGKKGYSVENPVNLVVRDSVI